TDIGGAVYSFSYDRLGNLVTQTSSAGQNRTYSYDAAGQVVGVTDAAINQQTTFAYDAAGHHVIEQTVQDGVVYQNNHLAYDTLGRLALVDDGRYHLTLEYDAVGNRTHETVHYVSDAILSTGATPNVDHDYWYAYDAMNREIMVDAANVGGALTVTA